MRRYSDVKYDKAETPVTETEEAEIIGIINEIKLNSYLFQY